MAVKYDDIERLKEIVAPIARQYGVERIYLFGSYARREMSEQSDIDLRIDKGNLRGLFALGGLHEDLQDALGVRVDLVTTGSLDDTFIRQIKNDEVLLYDRQA